jgi:phosphoglycerate dehydrogenase-like enzyme
MAEYVMAHALSLIVPLDSQRDAQRGRQWIATPFKEVNGSRWTIVGLGAIGREVASRALAFGARVTGVRRTPGEDPILGITHSLEELPGLLGDADVVVLAIPATRETRRMADARFFAALKTGAILINIARGGLIDLQALRTGLGSNKPGRVVLDTFEEEPLDPGSWLWDHPKVRVSAHTSWYGDKNGDRMDAQFLENLARFGSGQPLLNEASVREAELA